MKTLKKDIIAIGDSYKKVKTNGLAKIVEIAGYKMFYYKHQMHEYTTGMRICYGSNMQKAIEYCKERMKNISDEKMQYHIGQFKQINF